MTVLKKYWLSNKSNLMNKDKSTKNKFSKCNDQNLTFLNLQLVQIILNKNLEIFLLFYQIKMTKLQIVLLFSIKSQPWNLTKVQLKKLLQRARLEHQKLKNKFNNDLRLMRPKKFISGKLCLTHIIDSLSYDLMIL